MMSTRMPEDEKHHMHLGGTHHPKHAKHSEKEKHMHAKGGGGRSKHEMGNHPIRASAAGRDGHSSSDNHPKLPGLKEHGAVLLQKGKVMGSGKGSGGSAKGAIAPRVGKSASNAMAKPHMGPKPVR
jgi:hypothetical protein